MCWTSTSKKCRYAGQVTRASVPLDQWKEVELLEKKLTELYRWFFHPDYLTAMDKYIERLYLE